MNLGENSIKRSKHEYEVLILAAVSELKPSGVGHLLVVVEINVQENVLEKPFKKSNSAYIVFKWMIEVFEFKKSLKKGNGT